MYLSLRGLIDCVLELTTLGHFHHVHRALRVIDPSFLIVTENFLGLWFKY